MLSVQLLSHYQYYTLPDGLISHVINSILLCSCNGTGTTAACSFGWWLMAGAGLL
jgi:hypothetical protein